MRKADKKKDICKLPFYVLRVGNVPLLGPSTSMCAPQKLKAPEFIAAFTAEHGPAAWENARSAAEAVNNRPLFLLYRFSFYFCPFFAMHHAFSQHWHVSFIVIFSISDFPNPFPQYHVSHLSNFHTSFVLHS